jgi:hypothetical protein
MNKAILLSLFLVGFVLTHLEKSLPAIANLGPYSFEETKP